MKKNKRKQNGITLIALIITIIVMLILVGVTINVALNGGLFEQAQTAANDTQIQAEKEQLLSAVVGAIGTDAKVNFSELDINLPKDWTGSNGTYTSPKGNVFTVDEKGTIDYKGKNTTGGGEIPEGDTTSTVPDELSKYILGADGKGRIFMGESGIFKETFLDDPLTEDVDETQTLGVVMLTATRSVEDSSKQWLYVKSNDKAYKITVDAESYRSEKLELIYEPKGIEGQKTEDGWTILYDNGETAEAVSPTAMGELRLGHSEEASTNEEKLTQAITSYNTAITLINNYCKTLEGLPENKGVRSVGASTETSDDKSNKYYSDIIKTWNSAYNGVGKKGDMNWEQDLVRMIYWEIKETETDYWIASRIVYDKNPYDATGIEFSVRYSSTGNFYDFSRIWSAHDNGWALFNTPSAHAVRPIITIDNI